MTARHRISDRNVLVIGIWDFDIVWNLSIVIWDFSSVFGKANRFYLNKLEADFDVSLHHTQSSPHVFTTPHEGYLMPSCGQNIQYPTSGIAAIMPSSISMAVLIRPRGLVLSRIPLLLRKRVCHEDGQPGPDAAKGDEVGESEKLPIIEYRQEEL
jgi:hypothetical protein